MNNTFQTKFVYTDRKSKAEYIYLKYKSILTGNILDVGSDKCHLRDHLEAGSSYLGIGLGGNPDTLVNLEKGKIPFKDNSFDCVQCTDVLEHLENIHAVFDELCRVSRRWVIISLPSPWADFYTILRRGYYAEDRPMKFYNLPIEPPEDRHKWFFSTEEAEKFIAYRSAKNGMHIVQIDVQGFGSEGSGWGGLVRWLAARILFSNLVNVRNLYTGTLWAVLEK